MDCQSKIYISGHCGLLGSALARKLSEEGCKNLVLRTHEELDLTRQDEVERFFEKEKPEYVFNAAARVGGIKANTEQPADFIYENLQIQNNIIRSCWKIRVKKMIFLGSNCMYPLEAAQPYQEESIGNGRVEPTNEAYAVAKIAGAKMCQAYAKQFGCNFVTAIPASLYGPNDHFQNEWAHLIPSLLTKFRNAKIQDLDKIILWGSGNPLREYIYVDDAAQGLIFLMNNYNSSEPINLGTGAENSIKEIANLVNNITGFKGELSFDTTKPDGIPRKILDSKKIKSYGWEPETDLESGLKKTYNWLLKNEPGQKL